MSCSARGLVAVDPLPQLDQRRVEGADVDDVTDLAVDLHTIAHAIDSTDEYRQRAGEVLEDVLESE